MGIDRAAQRRPAILRAARKSSACDVGAWSRRHSASRLHHPVPCRGLAQSPSGVKLARAMPRLPSGTVTFLFTDIEASTLLLERLGDRYGEALEAHRGMLREGFAAHGGQVVDMEGDASFAVFTSASNAVEAASAIQRALAEHGWPEGLPLRVRIGVHSGEAAVR